MIWQVRANLYFDSQDEATDFYHDCEVALYKGIVVNEDTDAQEACVIEIIENHHDEDPNGPCHVLIEGNNAPG